MLGEGCAKKILVLGIDGLDPRLTRRFVNEGRMPNTKKFLEKGSAREDLVLLGAMPTITPPMWTTLATGAYPMTHGITCFWRNYPGHIDAITYNLDSRNCKAEQMWNVTAEAGLKTLVFHWPGSSWPPSSDSPLLHVVDGTQPSVVNMSQISREKEYIVRADVKITDTIYRAKGALTGHIPCVIDNLEPEKEYADLGTLTFSTEANTRVILNKIEGESVLTDSPFDVQLSQIKEPSGWQIELPEGAKEFVWLQSKGAVRRVCLILKNEEGVYDRVAIYKNKKAMEPIDVLYKDVFKTHYMDELLVGENKIVCMRDMRILELSEDGSSLKMWVGTALDPRIEAGDALWHPKSLYEKVVNNVGVPPAASMLGAGDEQFIRECTGDAWEHAMEWQSAAIHDLIKEEQYDVVFSHFHNVDAQGHVIMKHLGKGHNGLSAETYWQLWTEVYEQTDRYIGKFLHMIDEGWTILIVSDHGMVSPAHEVPMLSESSGINARVMQELGFTVLKRDKNGNDLHEVDWSKTKAIAIRCNHIYLNIKGRDPEGIVDPKDQYQVEEDIMTALYGYRDKETNERVVALALRNKDAALLGLSGPESGDIIYFLAEGYNFDHGDSLSTTWGLEGTSVSPIFMAAGPGIKTNYRTSRFIREVDVAPTVAILLGLRMPKECEGAPVYQIFEE